MYASQALKRRLELYKVGAFFSLLNAKEKRLFETTGFGLWVERGVFSVPPPKLMSMWEMRHLGRDIMP